MTTGESGTADPCPSCARLGSRVVDSRPYEAMPQWRRRRRACVTCGHRWSTVEVPLSMFEGLGRLRGEVEAVQLSIDRLQSYLAALAKIGLEKPDAEEG